MSLNEQLFFSVRFSSGEPFSWPAHHLALEFTRYAHCYPQDLWKTWRSRVQPLPANRCRTWFSEVPPESPSKAADDATAARD